jgi:hypothetical protein
MRHPAVWSLVALCWLSGGAPGCSYPSLGEAGPRTSLDLPARAHRDIDLLFLIDDSPSMADKQANLAGGFPRFADALASIPGGLPSIHLGVATTDLGTSGTEDTTPGPLIGAVSQGGCDGYGKAGNLQLYRAPVTGAPYIIDTVDPMTGDRVRNYTGALSDAFSQIARGAGAAGCGFEQHLSAIKRALDPANPVNTGFLRPDALLGVIIITDEDDCSLAHDAMLASDTTVLGPLQSFRCTRYGITCDSNGQTPDAMNQVGAKDRCHSNEASPYLTKVSDSVAFLKGLKADPAEVFVAGLFAPPTPVTIELRAPQGSATQIPSLVHSCSYTGADINGDGIPDLEVGDPAVRLQALVDAFGDHATASTICEQDLSGGLSRFADLMKTALGDPCIAGTLTDVDPGAAGTQAACVASVVSNADQPDERRAALPRCSPDDATAKNAPCWRLAFDPVGCPSGDHALLAVVGDDKLPDGARLRASCAVEPAP